MNTNSENPGVGKKFQQLVAEKAGQFFQTTFSLEKSIPIGTPPKGHSFDCFSEEKYIVLECKAYTWTDSGNVPSAKIHILNEAVFFLRLLPNVFKKILVMKRAMRPLKTLSLAEYYYQHYHHLFHDVLLMELNEESGVLKLIQENHKEK